MDMFIEFTKDSLKIVSENGGVISMNGHANRKITYLTIAFGDTLVLDKPMNILTLSSKKHILQGGICGSKNTHVPDFPTMWDEHPLFQRLF